MTTAAVRFDETVGLAHLIADGSLRCPRGVLVVTHRDTRNGSSRRVYPCGLAMRHAGDCEPARKLTATFTRCGLPMHDTPWVPTPDGAAPCPECYGLETDEQETLL